jgi:NDP-sugar pyrophosphorylase family protein
MTIDRHIEIGRKIQAVQVADVPFIDIGTPETVVKAEAFVRRHSKNFTWVP